jgi:hypothetical protein
MTSRRRMALLAAVSAVIVACAPPHPQSAPSPGSASPLSAGPTPSTAPAIPGSGSSNDQPYTVAIAERDAPDGHGRWVTRVGHLDGGDPAVTHAFNTAGDTSAAGLLDQVRADAHPGWWDWNFDITPAVTFRPTAISEVLTGVYYARQAAHPVDYISTIVIDARTAQPITLNALFRDEPSGLQRLSEQTRLLLPIAGGPGNEPREENFANWIPTAAGMEMHFRDYQFGHGLPVITVPWAALTDLLAPDMTALIP